jgi:phosphate transport system substrate-binding protein
MTLTLVAAACGDDDDTASDDTSDATSGATDGSGDLSGELIVSGSSTVEPISTAVAAAFSDANPSVAIDVSGPGTGDGFELFCNGETDVSDASRPIEAEEAEACEANGIEFVELKVGIDGLSVITSAENTSVECLSFADLYALLGPEATGSDWSDADELAAELPDGFGELHTPYPEEPLVVTAPGEESGTYDSFVELVLEGLAEERGLPEEEWAPRLDYQSSPNDNVIIDGVAGTTSSLGWVGFAFAEGSPDVTHLAVDGGDGCVEPNPETISSGEYPIARDLYIYVNAAKVEENPALAAFVDFYLSDEGIASVSDEGYVDLAADDLEATRATWTGMETGTSAGG